MGSKPFTQGIIVLSICLTIFALPTMSCAGPPRVDKTELVQVLLNSANQIYQLERTMIENINNQRYRGLETELKPIEEDMFEDVIYLLNWVLQVDEKQIEANYKLGEIYFLKSDSGEGVVNEKYANKALVHLQMVVAVNEKSGGRYAKLENVIKMIRELKSMTHN